MEKITEALRAPGLSKFGNLCPQEPSAHVHG